MIKKIFRPNCSFKLESGEYLESLEICYHDSGDGTKKVVWICHALTANSNPTEWWPEIVGKRKLIDTQKYRVICVNMIGSCYGSTGPTSLSANGKPYLLDFPQVTVRDLVESQNILREHLGIEEIELMMGASIGGFQAVEWAIMYPAKIKNLLLIACNARVSPWATAFNESQRMALCSDPTFTKQSSVEGGREGLKGARSIALLSYRSYDGYNITQKEEEINTLFAQKACSYQQYQGEKLALRFNSYSYYTLTKCIDSHNCGRGRGGVERALSQIEANSVVVGIESDVLFPIKEQIEMAKMIDGAKFYRITSNYGHDGFLLESEQTKAIIKTILKS